MFDLLLVRGVMVRIRLALNILCGRSLVLLFLLVVLLCRLLPPFHTLLHDPDCDHSIKRINEGQCRKRPSRIHGIAHWNYGRCAGSTQETPHKVDSCCGRSRFVAVQIDQKGVGEVERSRDSEADEEECYFWSGNMSTEFDGPSIYNDGQRADDVAWDGDLETHDFDGEVSEVLLFAFLDREAKATGMATISNMSDVSSKDAGYDEAYRKFQSTTCPIVKAEVRLPIPRAM